MNEPIGNGAPDPAQQVQQQLDALSGPIQQHIRIMVAGFQGCFPNVPAGTLFSVIAQNMGFILAGAMVADIPTHVQLRKIFKGAFEAGVEQAPRQMLPLQTGGETMPIRRN